MNINDLAVRRWIRATIPLHHKRLNDMEKIIHAKRFCKKGVRPCICGYLFVRGISGHEDADSLRESFFDS